MDWQTYWENGTESQECEEKEDSLDDRGFFMQKKEVTCKIEFNFNRLNLFISLINKTFRELT